MRSMRAFMLLGCREGALNLFTRVGVLLFQGCLRFAKSHRDMVNCIAGTSNVQVQGGSPQPAPTGRKLLQLDSKKSLLLGRILLQQTSSVPVTINASDYQQVLQNLGNLSSTSNLTSALQQAGGYKQKQQSLLSNICLHKECTP